DPNKGAAGVEFCFKHIARNSQNSRKQMRGLHFVVAKLGGNGKRRLHFGAHCQWMHVAVVNRPALGSDLYGALLLAVGAGEIVTVLNQLQIAEARENKAHPKDDASRDDQQTKLSAIFLHLCSRPDIVPAKLDSHNRSPAWSGVKREALLDAIP